jgi:3'-5' exonuclease
MRWLKSIPLEDLVFLDIETVPVCAQLSELSEEWQHIWTEREQSRLPEGMDAAAWFEERAGLYAEFGQVICISLGFFARGREGLRFRVKSIAYPDESLVLEEFSQVLHKHYPSLERNRLCGHNIKSFDLPYLCRRMLVQGMNLPAQLDLAGLKPWEIPHLDTMELWQFGDRRASVSLRLLAAALGVPSPKEDISGSDVGRVFWQDEDLDRIAAYCARDVVSTARIVLYLRDRQRLPDDAVIEV